MNKIFPSTLEKFFINKTSQHLYNTRGNSLDVPQVKTTTYGSKSFILHGIRVHGVSSKTKSILLHRSLT